MGPSVRAAALAALVALAACAAQLAGAPEDIAGIAWMRVDDEDSSPHFARLRIDGERASGYGGCNTFSAGVANEGARLRFTSIAATRMACAQSSMATERNMLAALERTRAYRLESGELVLLDSAGVQAARFIAE